jgi:murein DD-endopeptidase MepM/ murein hydrolase activator NlpD
VPVGTPVYATMDGDAVLIVNTVVNAFDYYGVDREPYLGNPNRQRAPINPFPGPGGGMGVYVAVINDAYRSDYGHLGLAATLSAISNGAFAAPYSRTFDFASAFAAPQPLATGVQIASWRAERGDIVGYTGDAGYSEAPHLHYHIARNNGQDLCPTTEPGFTDAGWLTR